MESVAMHIKTALIRHHSPRFNVNQEVWLKLECHQQVGSFKIRGVGHFCTLAAARGARSLVSSSGGNAGYAVAFAGRQLGLPVLVVVPESTPVFVQERLRELGARVLEHGSVWDEADCVARRKAGDDEACYVPPFDHPDLWAGHASVIDECALQGPRPDAVVVSVGGGGLMCGVLQGMHRVGWDEVPLLAVETEGAASLKAAVDHGGPIAIEAITSIAKTLGALKVAPAAWEWTTRHRVENVLVSDRQAVAACASFADESRNLVEPACGAALAVAYEQLNEARRLLIIVCGGIGVTVAQLLAWQTETA